MKHAGMLLVCVLFFSFALKAQENEAPSSIPLQDTTFSLNLPPAFASASLASLPTEPASSSPQVPISVVPRYSFQLYAGYTFVRLYAYPGLEANRNGFDVSASYFPRAGFFGVEGALTSTYGSLNNQKSDFAFAGGGPRVRWDAPRGLELWAHGLVGWSNFLPQIAGFSEDGLGYELGGGVDVNAHLQHFAFRVEGDMIGTRLYQRSQYSPKFSVGIVYKF
jgi:hypothetical protein